MNPSRSRHKPGPTAPTSAWKRLYLGLLHLNDTPGRIAGGVAIGVFIGVAPTFGLGILLAGGLAALFKCNPVAAMAGSVIGAPPMIFGVWLGSSWLGALLLGLDYHALYARVRAGEIFSAGWDAVLAYAVGNVIVTAALTLLAYAIVLPVMHRHQRRRAQRPISRA